MTKIIHFDRAALIDGAAEKRGGMNDYWLFTIFGINIVQYPISVARAHAGKRETAGPLIIGGLCGIDFRDKLHGVIADDGVEFDQGTGCYFIHGGDCGLSVAQPGDDASMMDDFLRGKALFSVAFVKNEKPDGKGNQSVDALSLLAGHDLFGVGKNQGRLAPGDPSNHGEAELIGSAVLDPEIGREHIAIGHLFHENRVGSRDEKIFFNQENNQSGVSVTLLIGPDQHTRC